MVKACAVTGHRPTRFKFKYKEDYSLCKKIKRVMREQFEKLYDECGVKRYYIGGTLGVDMWAGEIILRLKEKSGYEDIELVVVLPFPDLDKVWDNRSRQRLKFLLKHCSEYVVAGDRDCRQSYIKRNYYMVEHAEYILAIYDGGGDQRSKTMQMVEYARKNKRTVICIHPDTSMVKKM